MVRGWLLGEKHREQNTAIRLSCEPPMSDPILMGGATGAGVSQEGRIFCYLQIGGVMLGGWSECVIDATMGYRDGKFTFCPIEGDINGEYSVIVGMNYISRMPPEGLTLVAIVHSDGQDAVDAFCAEYDDALRALEARLYLPSPEELAALMAEAGQS